MFVYPFKDDINSMTLRHSYYVIMYNPVFNWYYLLTCKQDIDSEGSLDTIFLDCKTIDNRAIKNIIDFDYLFDLTDSNKHHYQGMYARLMNGLGQDAYTYDDCNKPIFPLVNPIFTSDFYNFVNKNTQKQHHYRGRVIIHHPSKLETVDNNINYYVKQPVDIAELIKEQEENQDPVKEVLEKQAKDKRPVKKKYSTMPVHHRTRPTHHDKSFPKDVEKNSYDFMGRCAQEYGNTCCIYLIIGPHKLAEIPKSMNRHVKHYVIKTGRANNLINRENLYSQTATTKHNHFYPNSVLAPVDAFSDADIKGFEFKDNEAAFRCAEAIFRNVFTYMIEAPVPNAIEWYNGDSKRMRDGFETVFKNIKQYLIHHHYWIDYCQKRFDKNHQTPKDLKGFAEYVKYHLDEFYPPAKRIMKKIKQSKKLNKQN